MCMYYMQHVLQFPIYLILEPLYVLISMCRYVNIKYLWSISEAPIDFIANVSNFYK